MNGADTVFIIISAALVMLMTPGLALFYAGMTRSKNVLGTIMQSFAALAVVSIVWALWGYSLAFGNDIGGLIGGLHFLGLMGVGMEPNPDLAGNIPRSDELTFFVEQTPYSYCIASLAAK